MQKAWRYVALGCVALFLASVATFYHPGLGFTALLGLPAASDGKTPTLQAIPHFEYPAWASYDGQFYVQRAFDPLIRDPAVDRAMDLAPFRARRILFSWTAFLLGFGRPAWIVNIYALQNVACWLILAALLTRWMPLTSVRGTACWAACLFSHGLLWSVRFSLLDGPSLLLTCCAVAAAERGRPLLSAAVAGISALGRETNLLALASQPVPRGRRAWLCTLGALALALLPLLIWYDYLRSIYRSTTLAGTDQLVWPGSGIAQTWGRYLVDAANVGLKPTNIFLLFLLLALAVQAAYLVVRREYLAPWWRVGAAYAGLMLLLDPVLANPLTGAITRVLLPLTVSFNVLIAGERRPAHFWTWCVAGNFHVLSALTVMPLKPW
jgi:hypothetical protein